MKIKNVEDMYPLSATQELMLVHSLSAPWSRVLFQQMTCTLQGALDRAAYQRAWQEVMARHPVLRTLFVWEGLPRMLQVVRQSVVLPWQELDWRHLPAREQEQQSHAFLQQDRARGFDPGHAPLMRCSLLRLSDEQTLFVWSSHHLLFDGWSRARLLAEVWNIYQALTTGEPLPTERPRPYREYIAWLHQQDQEAARQFWRRHLAGLPAPAPLSERWPVTGAPQAQAGYRSLQFRLPAALGEQVRALARTRHLTLNAVFLGAWLLLLGCIQQSDDLACGTTVSGRAADLPGIEAMIGLFINTLPVRARLTAGMSLLSFLHEVQNQQREMRLYEFTPLAHIQACSDLAPNQRLFESVVVFENYPQETEERPRSVVMRDLAGGAETGYPLTLVIECRQSIILEISYETGSWSEETITSLFPHLQMLLSASVRDPQQSVQTLQAELREHLSPAWLPAGRQETETLPTPAALLPTFSPPPRDEVERALTRIWEAVLGVEPIGVRDNFFHLGGHSFLALHLLARVQQHFGQALPLSALLQGATVEALAAIVRRQQAAGTLSPLVALQRGGAAAKPPFFCVHPSGGNVLCYYDLARHLGPDQPFYALEDPATVEEQVRHVRIAEMATIYLQHIRQMQPHGPYLLGGWSFGGLVAFEMAQQLQRQGERVGLLALIDTRPPTISGQLAGGDDASMLAGFAYAEARREGKTLLLPEQEGQEAGEEARLQMVVQEMKRIGLLGPEIGLRWVRRFLAQARAKTWAVQHYQPQPYAGPLTLFRTVDGITADLQQMPTPPARAYYGPAYGWDLWCTQPVEVYQVPASHLTIVGEPFVRTLAAQVQACLCRATTAHAELAGRHR
jgi:thioesterase domain-containing protein